jgi:hypothetical protein
LEGAGLGLPFVVLAVAFENGTARLQSISHPASFWLVNILRGTTAEARTGVTMRNPANTVSKDILIRENGIMKNTCSRKLDGGETQKCKKGAAKQLYE